jgi:hypothetical protein
MTTDVAAAVGLVRRHHAALRELFTRHTGEAADFRALRRVLGLCAAASEALDDAYCHEKFRAVGEYGAEMLSHSEHAKWGRDSTSGAQFLRQQVLNALELIASRLYSIEALARSRDSATPLGMTPWKTRSSFAQP